MNAMTGKFAALSVSSAVLMSLGWLFPHCGGFALMGFVPLLWMDRLADRHDIRHFFWWYYLTFVLWNAITTWWVSIATLGGGIFAVIANAFFMALIWASFRLVKRRFHSTLPYIYLVASWIAWERFYFSAEVSWPWLTLGNAFAYSPTCVQWYEVLGTLGGSLWIWLCNMALFGLMAVLEDGRWQKYNGKARAAAIAATILVFVAPLTESWVRYATYEYVQDKGSIDCLILQPNFDPYAKFESLSQSEQNKVALDLMKEGLSRRDSLSPCLVLAPETFTSDIVLNEISTGPTINAFRQAISQRPNTNMIFGASTYEFFDQHEAPSYTARPFGFGRWYEDHNSALVIDSSPRIGLYHKSRLVVAVEKMPWPRFFSNIDKMLGGVMGHCTGQDHVGLLDFVLHDPEAAAGQGSALGKATTSDQAAPLAQSTPLGCAICYESVYPEYFASYVAAGARAMTVITNDSWWGDTPGYHQHMRYSTLRAIETRRDIARSANTGISAIINQRGDVVSCTLWDERTSLDGRIYLNDHITPFVKYGDIVGRLATFLFLLIFFAYGVNLITHANFRRR